MNKLRAVTAAFLPVFALCTTLLTVPSAEARRMMVPGEEAQSRTTMLSQEIRWHKDLSAAQTQARRQGKLIFWMHMLGQIDGVT